MKTQLFAVAALPIIYYLWTSDPLSYILPNLLLFTNQRELTLKLWEKYVVINKAIIKESNHVPVIMAADYTFENLRIATENWKYPAVVRGLFSNTPAVTNWKERHYLPSQIGEFSIPYVRNAVVGTIQNNRSTGKFKDIFDEIHSDPQSKYYLFFPVQSRFATNHSELATHGSLQKKVDDLVMKDLKINEIIWNGFGTKSHKSFYGSQFVIGKGTNDTDDTTGTGWHCAAGNNWFVQVVGSKRWYFIDQEYSALLSPLRGGLVNMMAGKYMAPLHKHIKMRHADIQAGDLLYNPDWEWHTIRNYDGLSIGVPIRELNFTLSFRNNFQYSMIVVMNRMLKKMNIDIGGYPPAAEDIIKDMKDNFKGKADRLSGGETTKSFDS